MRRTLFLWLSLSLLLLSERAVADAVINQLHAHVNYLSSNALAGRLTGSHGEKLATQYVANEFQKSGLTPAGDHGTYFEDFIFRVNKKIRHGRNVLAMLPGTAQNSAWIIIGAHIDHLGHGELGGSRARANEAGKIHPGADDNASGVATMLEAAAELRRLQQQHQLPTDKTILFAAWSGEEIGILGSTYFAKKMLQHVHHSLHVDAVINLDMVGHLKKNLVLQGVGSSRDWRTVISQSNVHPPFHITLQNDPYLPTDATSFYLRHVPTLNFFTGAGDEYHTPRDTAATLNYTGMKNITAFLVALIATLDKSPHNLHFQAVNSAHAMTQRGFKVYLGTIPDYTSQDGQGVKLSGVAKNSPADRAGLQQNDVIKQLAHKKVHDIYDYTFALNALQANKVARLRVQRGQKNIWLSITPQHRS